MYYEGDVIAALIDHRSAVILAFGEAAFDTNVLGWRRARRKLSSLRLVGNPFLEVPHEPLLLEDGQDRHAWGLFVPSESDSDKLEAHLRRAVDLAYAEGIEIVITNFRWLAGWLPQSSMSGVRVLSTAISDGFLASS